MLDSLKNLLTPKIGLSMVKNRLEKELKKDIKFYSIFYSHHNKEIHFNITDLEDKKCTVFFDDKDNSLTSIIESQMKGYIEKKDVHIDAFEIEFTEENKIKGKIYYKTPDGKKEFANLNI